jgi:hypothetical protein
VKNLVFASLLLVGCASMAKVEPGSVTVGGALVVRSDGHWNRVEPPQSEADASEVWTAEGVTLDMLLFYVGVADGETLGTAQNQPVFRASMLPHEIVELYEALVAQDGSAFRLERLAPASFGGTQGFLFEHRTTLRNGLALHGRAYGSVVEGRLYLMSFTAPDSHFYAKHLPSVDALAASAKIMRRESGVFASP